MRASRPLSPPPRPARLAAAAGCVATVLALAACSPTTSGAPAGQPAATTPAGSTVTSATPTAPSPPATPTSSSVTSSAAPSVSAPPASTSVTPPAATSSAPTPTSSSPRPSPSRQVDAAGPTGKRPVIVVDPGHSPSIHAIDPKTGLDVSDYENEPEMRDVYAVALLVKSRLDAAGYHVVLTKPTVDSRRSLAARAYLANRVHAALALSIHDQAGANGGIGFRSGNNTVYYQSVGTYRSTPSGKKVRFTDQHLAAVSKKFGAIFRTQREKAQGVHVALQDNVGYNLGSRGLAAGNIWIVQLLSKVPWIYNEAGGNSSGRVGLSHADESTYASGLVAAVERCVPVRH